MDELERIMGLTELTPEEERRLKHAVTGKGLVPEEIRGEGEMEPMAITGRRGVVQMPEEEIRGKKTIQLDPMTIDPRASVRVGDVTVQKYPKGRPDLAGVTSVADLDEPEDQSTRMLKGILAEERPVTVAEEDLPPRDFEANALRRMNAGQAGNAMRGSPGPYDRAKALVARAQGQGRSARLREAFNQASINPALSEAFGTAGRAPAESEEMRRPLVHREGAPNAAELELARNERIGESSRKANANAALRRALATISRNTAATTAALARNIRQGMDIAYPDARGGGNAGAGVAEAGQAALDEVLADERQAESNRRAQVSEEGEAQDRSMRQQRHDLDVAQINTRMATDRADADPESEPSRNARADAVALYPKVVAQIPPDQFKKMSRRDIQMLFSEAQMMREPGGGGGGRKGPGFKGKDLPKDSYAIEQSGRELDSIVASLGGWDKVKGVGFVEGAFPKATLEPKAQRIRSLAESMIIPFRHGYFGATLTKGEKESANRAIASIEGGRTVSEIVNGMEILRRINRDKVDQAMAFASAEDQETARRFYQGQGADVFDRRGQQPTSQPVAKEPTGYRWNADRTKRKPVFADGSEGPVEEVR